MTTDFRALCAELLAHAKKAQSIAAQDLWFGDEDDGLFDRARAALAEQLDQPSFAGLLMPPPSAALAEQPVVPTDEELLDLMPETMRDEFSYAAKTCSDVTGGAVKPGIFRVVLNTAALEYARAALARWGRQ